MELRFGDAAAMLKLVEMIADRQGIGDLLADGVRRAAEVIGGDARTFAMHVKGQELPMHDPRGKVGVGFGYHRRDGRRSPGGVPRFGVRQRNLHRLPGRQAARHHRALPPRELSPKKAALYAVGESWSAAGKVIGFCYFGPAPRSFIQVEEAVEAVHAATGWDMSVAELLHIGERAVIWRGVQRP